MNKITTQDFWNSNANLAINCRTYGQYLIILGLFKMTSIPTLFTEYSWKDFREETCYTNNGKIFTKGVAKSLGYKIYDFDEVALDGSLKQEDNFIKIKHYIFRKNDFIQCTFGKDKNFRIFLKNNFVISFDIENEEEGEEILNYIYERLGGLSDLCSQEEY